MIFGNIENLNEYTYLDENIKAYKAIYNKLNKK